MSVSRLPGRLVLLGHPVSHSLSPAFQNAALRHAGVPLEYEPLDVPPVELASRFAALAAQRTAGNVTTPHKALVAALCDRLTSLAGRVGAVNTFWHEEGGVVGDNTDVGGVDEAVAALLGRSPAGLRVALIGAGGAASAVLAAAERWPDCRVTVWSRRPERCEALVARFADVATAADLLADAIRSADLVVNATPTGLTDDGIPVPPALLRRRAAVLDLVYRRDGPTPWVRLARALGRPAIDGLPMLIAQGALAFERWLGQPPDRDVMWAAVGRGRTTAAGGVD